MRAVPILADLHAPFHDAAALRLVGKVVRPLRPEKIILAGDLYDFYSISRFDRDPERVKLAGLKREQAVGRAVLDEIGSWTREVIYLPGNHEDRFRKYIWRHAGELAGLCEEDGRETLDFNRLFIGRRATFWTGRDGYLVGKLNVRHGSLWGQPSSVVNRTRLRYPGRNVVVAHNHSIGFVGHTGAGRTWGYWSCGHLSDPAQADWLAEEPDWQQGFLVASFAPSGRFSIESVPIFRKGKRRSCIFRGKEYTA